MDWERTSSPNWAISSDAQHQPERLQKFLARAGVASRCHAEALTLDGRVRVNGRVVTELGTMVQPGTDEVVTTASDPQGRWAVLDLLSVVATFQIR